MLCWASPVQPYLLQHVINDRSTRNSGVQAFRLGGTALRKQLSHIVRLDSNGSVNRLTHVVYAKRIWRRFAASCWGRDGCLVFTSPTEHDN